MTAGYFFAKRATSSWERQPASHVDRLLAPFLKCRAPCGPSAEVLAGLCNREGRGDRNSGLGADAAPSFAVHIICNAVSESARHAGGHSGMGWDGTRDRWGGIRMGGAPEGLSKGWDEMRNVRGESGVRGGWGGVEPGVGW